MSDVTYRAARAEDIPAMMDVFLNSCSDMLSRHGLQSALPASREAMYADYGHILRTGIFRLAELDGEVVSIAAANPRDHLWFLSAFWTRPEVQGRGIGMPLLRQVWQEGYAAGCRTFYVWSSVDPAAIVSYLKLGMLPGFPILLFAGAPRELAETPVGCEAVPLEPETAMAFDLQLLGTRRDVDHAYLAAVPEMQQRQVLRGGKVVGYYYLGPGAFGPATLGPAGWLEQGDAAAVLGLALQEARVSGGQVAIAVPGINHDAIRLVLSAGLRLTRCPHFFTSAPFGRLKQYLPSGPELF